MKKLKLLTIIVMLLVISLPICFAQTITIDFARSNGDDDIGNLFDGLEDNWNIEVIAHLGGEEVKPEMIVAEFAVGPREFETCRETEISGYYLCSFKIYGAGLLESKNYCVPVRITHPITGEADEKDACIDIDSDPPQIEILSISQSGYNATLNIRVKDGGSEVCSIDRIEFFDGADKVRDFPPSPDITDCNWHEFNDVQLALTDTIPSKTIRAVAYDLVGHSGNNDDDPESSTFILDQSPPQININSFRFGSLPETQYMPGGSFQTDIIINITEEQTTGSDEVLTAKGDFLEIGLGAAETTVCELKDSVSGLYTCTWPNMQVTLQQSFSLVITAIDNNGIEAEEIIQKNYLVDTTAPEIDYLGGDESNYVVTGRPNTLRADFIELESGINADNIILDASGINSGSGYSSLEASRCVQEQNLWHCYWDDVLARNAGEITLIDVKDIANNYAVNLPSVQMNVDNEDPILISPVSILAMGAYGAREYFQSDDYLQITAEVSDISGVKAYADLSHVILTIDHDNIEADCEQNADNWICSWTVGPLRSGHITSAPVTFTFEDFVGNQLEVDEHIEILETIEETSPDYWTIESITNMPDAIDRQTTANIEHRMYFTVSLDTDIYGVSILNTDIERCDGNHLYNNYMMGNFVGNENPIIVLELETFDSSDLLELNYTCVMNIFSRKEGSALEYPEQETINLTIPLYNIPIGTAEGNLENKIKSAKKKISNDLQWMGWVQEIIDWSKYLCLILETYDTIRNVYNAISVGIDVLRVYPPSYVAAVVVCGTSHTAGNVGEYGLTETLKQYCGFISCKEDYSSWAGIWRKNFNRYWGFTALGLEPNPYDNIVMAVGNLCLPAILYNVAKQRQIECRYVYCLEKEVPAGIPIKACNELKSYQYCKYWKGEIFSMIPFVGALNQLSGIIKSIITDPIGALNLIGALACGEICPVSGTLSAGCNVYIWYKAVIDLWEDIDQIQKGPEKISNDFCHQVDLGVF